jgi:hypothetical protein
VRTMTLDTAPTIPTIDDMAKRKPKTLSDQLRQAVRDAGCSRYAISKETGIDQSVLSKFVTGERGLSSDSADLLCEFLELDLVKRPRGKRKKR